MDSSRRRLLSLASTGFAAALAVRAAHAATTDLAVTCDAAAEPAVIAAGLAFRQLGSVRIRVFPTAPGLILPQLQREIQNDILFTQISILDQAEAAGLVQPGNRAGPWRNRLVTAVTKDQRGPEGSFAIPDPSPGSAIDGPAVLRRLGPSPAKVMGVVNTGAVAWSLTNAEARQGLLHQTEVWADDRLRTVLTVPDDAWPPILYAATVTKLARRGDPAAFITFLNSPPGQAALRSAGLETAS